MWQWHVRTWKRSRQNEELLPKHRDSFNVTTWKSSHEDVLSWKSHVFFTWSFVRLWKLPGKAATVYTWYPDSERCLCSLLWQICASVNVVLPLAVVPTDRRDLLGFPTFPRHPRWSDLHSVNGWHSEHLYFLCCSFEKNPPPQPPAGSYVSSTSWTPPLWFLALLLWLIDLFDPFSSNNWMWRLRSLRRFCRKTLKKKEKVRKRRLKMRWVAFWWVEAEHVGC